ncbi:MAG: hypothetical protein Q9217_001360 [Psora testacea]
MTNFAFGKDQEITKHRDENDVYQANPREFERERGELKREQACKKISDKFKSRTKQIREELEKKIQALQTDIDELKDARKKLEKKNIQAQEDSNGKKRV